MKIVMAKTAADLLLRPLTSGEAPGDPPMLAAREAVRVLAERGRGTGGLILLDREGRPGYSFNTPRMAYGMVTEHESFLTGV